MKIPSDSLWTQTNTGDTHGVLHTTQNCSLDTIGKLTGTRKPVALMSSTVDVDFGYPLAIVYFANTYNVLTDDAFFSGSIDENHFTQEADITGTFSLGSDMVVYNDLLHISENANFMSWDGVTGDIYSLGTLTAGVPHPMGVFGTSLVIGNGNEVILYDSSYVVLQTLTLPTAYEVTTLRVRNNYIYIGTKHKFAGEASIFVWDGDSALYNYDVPVGASWIFSMTEYGPTVAAITSQGQLGYVNGTSFTHLAGLPVFYNPHARWQGSGGLQLNGKVFNRGMVTVGNNIYMNIEGNIDVGFIPEMKSGIWVYDPEIGLYHRSNSSTDLIVADELITISDNTITTSNPHALKTGDAVQFSGTAGITGITNNIPYYVTVTDTDAIKLSNSRKAVTEGNYMAISGAITIGSLVYIPNTDYGSNQATSGAIAVTAYNETPIDILAGEILWGCRTFAQDGTNPYVLNTFADQYNISRFETQRIYSSNISQNWKEIYAFVDGITYENEEVVLKVQKKPSLEPISLVGLWTSVNTIVTSDVTYTTAWADIVLGSEIIFTDGYGQGRTAHITNIEHSATVYTLTLDEDIGSVGDTSTFYTSSFELVTVLTRQNNTESYIKDTLYSISSPWIKLAAEVRGFTPSINMLEVSNSISKGTQ